MAKGFQILEMLIPQGGWYMYGEDYSGIKFIDCEPITEAEFNAGFAQYDTWKAEQDAQAAAKKQALLDRLGITQDEARLLLS